MPVFLQRPDSLGECFADGGIGCAAQGQAQRRMGHVCRVDQGLDGFACVALDGEGTRGQCPADLSSRGGFITGHGRGAIQPFGEMGGGGARLDDDEIDRERRNLLGHGLDEPFDPHLVA